MLCGYRWLQAGKNKNVMRMNIDRPAKNPVKPVESVTLKVNEEKIPPKNNDKSVNPDVTIPMIPKITA